MLFNLLNLSPYGFKRKNQFLNFVAKIVLFKKIRYFTSILFSILLIFCDISNSELWLSIKRLPQSYFLTMKYQINNISKMFTSIAEYMDIKNENAMLKQENNILKLKLATIKNIEKELDNLSREVNLKYAYYSEKYIEKVLGFDKGAYDSFLLISSTHQNAKKGMPIIVNEGLVGIIWDSCDNLSRAITIADPKICIPVKSHTGEHMILSGNGKNKMISQLVKQSGKKINISIGDILYTSGEGGIFPIDVPVAKVIEIQNSINKIIAIPLVDIDNISFVWIIHSISS